MSNTRAIADGPVVNGIDTLTTIVPEGFEALAIEKYGMTPENLSSILLTSFMQHPPEKLNIMSATPMNTQECERCPIESSCRSKFARVRQSLICLEKIVIWLPAAAWLLQQICDAVV